MQFEDFTGYKYIRLDTGEFRFAEVRSGGATHKQLLKENEDAVSAGIITIFPEYFKFFDHGSLSLNLYSWLRSDTALLEKIIGKPIKEN